MILSLNILKLIIILSLICLEKQNINQIETVLASRDLPLTSYDLGGKSGRKLIYYTHKNEVLIKPLTENTSTENEIALLLENFIFNI